MFCESVRIIISSRSKCITLKNMLLLQELFGNCLIFLLSLDMFYVGIGKIPSAITKVGSMKQGLEITLGSTQNIVLTE